MIITFERASKQAGWNGDPDEDRIMIRSYETDEDIKERLCTSEFKIEAEDFDTIGDDSLSVKVTIFSDAVDLLADGNVVRGLRNIDKAMSLDVVEAELAGAGIAELIVLSKDSDPRIIDNQITPTKDKLKADGLALYILGSAFMNKPAMLGTTVGGQSESEARQAIERARDIAVSLGYPESVISVEEIKLGGNKSSSDNSIKPEPGAFRIPGPGTDQ